ncbi:MAG: hypothetical protein IKA51_02755 [Clostridia bacterium]|nr:hypothetical protein [Clostridia bacterium]
MFLKAYKRALAVLVKKPVLLWGLSLMAQLLLWIAGIITLPIVALTLVATYLIQAGLTTLYLDGLQGKAVNSDQLFAAFNKNGFRIAGGFAWRDLWLVIWGLIPLAGPVLAIIKSYEYRFVPYILMTKPEVSATAALRLSKEMTKGKKTQMFLADLLVYVAYGVVNAVLALFAAIPFVGILFGIVLFAFNVVFFALQGIFTGLYSASFYLPEEENKAEDTAA